MPTAEVVPEATVSTPVAEHSAGDSSDVEEASQRYSLASTRPPDDRPEHDAARLAELGIHRYASRRLVLYSDIDPAVAAGLPSLVDAIFPAWETYFGRLPPAEDGSDFQLTGYLMRDRGLFRECGLLPEDLIEFEHGRHRGYQFWMNEQSFDYYRRHLLLHEATHCYMLIPPTTARPPLFYLEGMAELFGTHRIDAKSKVEFRTMPADPSVDIGFGRIEMIRSAIAAGELETFGDVLEIDAQDFAASRSLPYAWSWAMCKFLDTHPRYRERFRELAPIAEGNEFRRAMRAAFADDLPHLAIEWELFTTQLEYGFDIERFAIDFVEGTPLPVHAERSFEIAADRGWQSSGIRVEAGRTYQIVADGQVTLAQSPVRWESEPRGVSIEYANGERLGRLRGLLIADAPMPAAGMSSLHSIDIGPRRELTPAVTGTLYLRVNDHWSSLADNVRGYRITVQATTP
ncbi:MAG: hypothetical protein R3B90_09775 [Planctomycetaceae bacterium]